MKGEIYSALELVHFSRCVAFCFFLANAIKSPSFSYSMACSQVPSPSTSNSSSPPLALLFTSNQSHSPPIFLQGSSWLPSSPFPSSSSPHTSLSLSLSPHFASYLYFPCNDTGPSPGPHGTSTWPSWPSVSLLPSLPDISILMNSSSLPRSLLVRTLIAPTLSLHAPTREPILFMPRRDQLARRRFAGVKPWQTVRVYQIQRQRQ